MYHLYDDNGTMHKGARHECIDVFESWTKTQSARKLYTPMELSKIREVFNSMYEVDIECITFSGFTLEKNLEITGWEK